MRVDVEGLVQIVRAARAFDWTWTPGDTERFARTCGWTAPDRIEEAGEYARFARTSVHVWDPSAIFWHDDEGLRQVHVGISDSPNHFKPEHTELLAAAMDTAATALSAEWGAPTGSAIGGDHGPAWEFDELAIGLTSVRDTVELMLLSSRTQRFWDERRQRRASLRAGLTDWDRYAESLADYLDDLYSDSVLIVGAPGGFYAQFAKSDDQLYAELSQSAFVDEDRRYGPEVDLILAADGWAPPGPSTSNWQRSYAKPIRTADYSQLAWRVVAGLHAMGVTVPTDLQATGWRAGNRDLDTTALRCADDSPWAAVRTDGSHEVPSEPERRSWSDELELDVPGTLAVIEAASTFDWTWTRADVERFAEHAGWQQLSDLKLDRMIYGRTSLALSYPKVIFWLDGDALEHIQVTISSDVSDYDLESDSYAYLKDELELTFRAATQGLRDALGDPLHGTLRFGKNLCWDLSDATAGVVHNHDSIVLELVGPANRDSSSRISLRHTVEQIQRTAWNQATEDLGAIIATLPVGSALTVTGADHCSARFTALPGHLELELDFPDDAKPPSDSTAKHMIGHQGWTPPDDTDPRWRKTLPSPAMQRDHHDLAFNAIWFLRTKSTAAPRDLTLRTHPHAAIAPAAWPWS
ncbi:hypothetical protein GCM10027167_45920 [Nocardia heshunensis]